jgi:hypothetical protein
MMQVLAEQAYFFLSKALLAMDGTLDGFGITLDDVADELASYDRIGLRLPHRRPNDDIYAYQSAVDACVVAFIEMTEAVSSAFGSQLRYGRSSTRTSVDSPLLPQGAVVRISLALADGERLEFRARNSKCNQCNQSI